MNGMISETTALQIFNRLIITHLRYNLIVEENYDNSNEYGLLYNGILMSPHEIALVIETYFDVSYILVCDILSKELIYRSINEQELYEKWDYKFGAHYFNYDAEAELTAMLSEYSAREIDRLIIQGLNDRV